MLSYWVKVWPPWEVLQSQDKHQVVSFGDFIKYVLYETTLRKTESLYDTDVHLQDIAGHCFFGSLKSSHDKEEFHSAASFHLKKKSATLCKPTIIIKNPLGHN